jgi:hypothetical protein
MRIVAMIDLLRDVQGIHAGLTGADKRFYRKRS